MYYIFRITGGKVSHTLLETTEIIVIGIWHIKLQNKLILSDILYNNKLSYIKNFHINYFNMKHIILLKIIINEKRDKCIYFCLVLN